MSLLNIKEAIEKLKNERQIFHSEADFQFSLAWIMQSLPYGYKCFLEYPHEIPEQKELDYIDLVVEHENKLFAIELKYKTLSLEVKVDNMEYKLRNQTARDVSRYDVLKDLKDVETLVSARKFSSGYVIFLTNDPLYWKESDYKQAYDLNFHLFEGRIIENKLTWNEKTSPLILKSRPGLNFKNTYPCTWNDFSVPAPEKHYSRFRYLLFQV